MLYIINILDLIPLFIVALFLTTKQDINIKHCCLKLCCRFIINIIVILFFVLLVIQFNFDKEFVLILCFIIWGIMVFLEKNYLKYILQYKNE
jgi:hypothetical protein